jgi:spore coat protein U-like protein
MSVTLRILLALLVLLGVSARADAACQITSPVSIGLTTSSSYDVKAGMIATVGSTGGFACNGSIISLLSANYARATMTSANGFKLSAGGSDTISYTVSADAAGTYKFTQGGSIDYMNASLLSLLGILNGGAFAPNIYVGPTGTPNVAAGTYTDTLTVQWAWNVCHGVGVGGVCLLPETGTGTATILVSIIVTSDCRISAPALSFGSAPLASSFAAVDQAVAVDCTKGSVYKVSFTVGNAGSARPWRAMSDGSGHQLQYNIYRTDGTTIWDETNPQTASTPGTGATTPTQMQSYRARINPSQITPPAGHYTDTVSVVVSF